MKLWVLCYPQFRAQVFVQSRDETAYNAKTALKFQSREEALAFRDQHRRLWMYEPVEVEFDSAELER